MLPFFRALSATCFFALAIVAFTLVLFLRNDVAIPGVHIAMALRLLKLPLLGSGVLTATLSFLHSLSPSPSRPGRLLTTIVTLVALALLLSFLALDFQLLILS